MEVKEENDTTALPPALKYEENGEDHPNLEEKSPDTSKATATATKKPKSKGKARNAVAGGDNMDADLKKLTQRRINVAGAPKMPLNGYVRFMNDRREQLRCELPNLTALEHTKMIGLEWHQLTEDRRTPYLEAAAKDKALYQEQMQKFFKEHPEIVANELAKAKKVDNKNASIAKEKPNNNNNNGEVAKKTNIKTSPSEPMLATVVEPKPEVIRTPTPPALNVSALTRPFTGEIPIYTNEFIEHNRSTENELRMLRKAKTDLEQQNAVLEQHVDNTKAGLAKVTGEVTELKEEHMRLEKYLRNLRQKLVAALGGLALTPPPHEPSELNMENVDKYIQHLSGWINTTAAQQNNAMLVKVAESLSKIDTASLQKS
ncbi:CG9418 [Drosophila busckii]|uniref:CG9418 n=1 Tax=Drosophila busckii TaxID=30019 RepID=A0A0M4E4C4_DROBS|nr:high mobility group protein 20A [Drosophila busckii]ALC40866.1 CG9418 [Drosophila busckii]